MAAMSEQAIQTTTVTSSERDTRSEVPRGGNRGSRRGHREGVSYRDVQQGARGSRRGGRGNKSGMSSNSHAQRTPYSVALPAPPIPPPPGLGGGGSFGDRLTEDARTVRGEEEADLQRGTAEEVEAEVCFICASSVVHNSLAPCNHRTCHICALRLRALYKTRACAHCRVSNFHNVC